jgi:hypothetical protein
LGRARQQDEAYLGQSTTSHWGTSGRRKPHPVDATVLIAPDVDAAGFEKSLEADHDAIFEATKSMVLIGSSNDAVLQLSALRHRTGLRAGQMTSAMAGSPDVVFVDCDDCTASNFGHTYQPAAVDKLFRAFQSSPAVRQERP